MYEEQEKLLIEFGEKSYLLSMTPFSEEINIDEILKIDYANIFGEILTFPVLFNRIGLLKAEVDNIVAIEKFNLEVFHAQLSEEYSKQIIARNEKATEKKVTDAVLLDSNYISSKKVYFKLLRQQSQIDSLYWSAKSKDNELDKLTDKLRPEEFNMELLEDTVNGVLIKEKKKLIN